MLLWKKSLEQRNLLKHKPRKFSFVDMGFLSYSYLKILHSAQYSYTLMFRI